MFVSEDKVRYTTVLVHRATGFVVSLTVTTAEQVLVFPLPSVAVSVTVLAPDSEQVNVDLDKVKVGVTVQLSLRVAIIWAVVMDTVPSIPRETVVEEQVTVGETVSLTVITTEQLPTFPLVSLTVSVTVFEPMSAQVNVVLLNMYVVTSIPQLSYEGIFDGNDTESTSVGLTVPFPEASNCKVYGSQKRVGGVVSLTVTLTVQLCELPLVSVTVMVTVLEPTKSLHVNSVLLKPYELIPQLSVEPASTVLVTKV
jgi:hypothetical protein